VRALTDRSIAQEEKRRLILAAAVRVFARKGFHTCRVGDIAEEAGVAHGLLYHYFSSKDELLQAVFRETWAELLELLEGVADSDKPAREQLQDVASVLLRSWQHDPDLVRVLVREVARSPQLQEQMAEVGKAFGAIKRIVEQGQRTGELRAELDPQLVSVAFHGAIEEILTGWVLGTLPDADDDVERAERTVVEVMCGGLAADRAPATA
jgi:TetR/AcrR family transcriptional regulator, fatty acid metabolism regulator protein